MKRNDAEHRLQCSIVQILYLTARKDVEWFAVPNGSYRSKRTAARLKAEGVRAGQPDLVFIINGFTHGLELKVGKGRQSEAQRATELRWSKAQARYAVARGFDEAMAVLRKWGALSGQRPSMAEAA